MPMNSSDFHPNPAFNFLVMRVIPAVQQVCCCSLQDKLLFIDAFTYSQSESSALLLIIGCPCCVSMQRYTFNNEAKLNPCQSLSSLEMILSVKCWNKMVPLWIIVTQYPQAFVSLHFKTIWHPSEESILLIRILLLSFILQLWYD